MNGKMWNNLYNLTLLKSFGMECRPVKQLKVVECFFEIPIPGCVLICSDGASQGNPGISGYGFMCRYDTGEVLCAETEGLGITIKFISKVIVVIKALEWAVEKVWLKYFAQFDSKATISVFQSGFLPWIVLARWYKLKKIIGSLHF
ncbi:uncharacterized protein LOC113294626 [Papaver somniferum]|uniref:uncharacterized protein LOC113294626 n=1 Tax=Papaver somniferum TaxID=3469 RepID=UPI000E70058C|nr:uncharacterized protein LOC113294626 [Papaver somniferum]